jgi:hypothetical protein
VVSVKRFLVVGGAGAVSGVACFGLPPSEKIYRQPRGRVRQNMNSPRLRGLPHAQPATEEAGRSMGAGPELF